MMQETAGMGHLLWMLILAAIIVVPFWQICRKAGYTGWLSLLILFPVVNLGLLYFLAFARWPAIRGSGDDSIK